MLGHELSNSLAPIKSIAGSLLARVEDLRGDEAVTNDFRRGLGVVESRADALHRFVQSYRLLAQLPPPRLRPVALGPLIERVHCSNNAFQYSSTLVRPSISTPTPISWSRC